MTPEQLETANEFVDWHMEKFFGSPDTKNVTFHHGYIEAMDFIKDSSIDVVISNCVVNLSPKKDLVFKEVFRVLKPGGEFYFSDMYCDRRLPGEFADDPELHNEGNI